MKKSVPEEIAKHSNVRLARTFPKRKCHLMELFLAYCKFLVSLALFLS